MQEFNLINKFFKPLNTNKILSRNLSDDTSSIHLKNSQELIISKDIFVENIHFKLSDGAKNIASKLLATNLSDIASSGAKPYGYMLGIGKTSNLDENFFSEFCTGLKDLQKKFHLDLIGGDTVNSKIFFLSITIFGIAQKNKILSRQNAKSTDLIFVSGSIGDAGLGLKLLAKKKLSKNIDNKYLINRHLQPTPRIKLGNELLNLKLSKCAIDVSDGLLADVKKICESSKIDAKIYLDKIPFSKQAKKFLKENTKHNPLELLSSGDDYELVFSAKKKDLSQINSLAKKLKINLTCIGEFIKNNQKNNFQIILLEKINNNDKLTKTNKNNYKIIKNFKLGYEHS
jgi:thiamine-monophosphate kinase